MAENKMVRLYTPSQAARVIDRQLRQKRVTGNPFSSAAVTALSRESQIAASFCGVGRPEITAVAEVVSSSETLAPLDLGLLFDSNSDMVAMKKEVTIGQMKQFVEEKDYRPKGDNVEQFSKLIVKGDASAPMVYTNEIDCLAFAMWALPGAQAQDPRILTLGLPSDGQWVRMRQAFRGQQTGENWERLDDNAFRSFPGEYRDNYGYQEGRCDGDAIRLVGTYKKN